MQRYRIRADNQIRASAESTEPHAVVSWLADQTGTLEQQIKRALDAYTDSAVVGQWAKSIVGIGPVLAAGLQAHIDITRAPTVGHIWRFAGLDPTVTWAPKTKRPWNAQLKTLCWKIGESFVKQSGHEDCLYGHLYQARKAQEVARNAAGAFADQAAASLESKRWRADTTTKARYEAGELPDARLHLRAERYATKLFLAHWHAVAYRAHFGADAPKPYVVAHLGHTHLIQVPNWPWP